MGHDPEFDHPPRGAGPSAHALAAGPAHTVSVPARQTRDRDDDHTGRIEMSLLNREDRSRNSARGLGALNLDRARLNAILKVHRNVIALNKFPARRSWSRSRFAP